MGRTPEELDKIEEMTRQFLESSWDDRIECYLAISSEVVVGGGAVSFHITLPTHKRPNGIRAHIHNVYVEPEYRNKGIATKIMEYIIAVCDEKGITRFSLVSTEMGVRLYERLGFVKSENYYRMRVNQST
jgi:ribosomal protein S18 acetylase RimI-like enzyme